MRCTELACTALVFQIVIGSRSVIMNLFVNEIQVIQLKKHTIFFQNSFGNKNAVIRW